MEKSKLYDAICKAQAMCSSAAKSGENTYDRYTYATLHDYCEIVRPAMAKNDLALTINVTHVERLAPRKTNAGKEENVVQVMITGRLLHSSGDYEDYTGYGEGQDRADKAIYKAITGAKKYLISNIFNVPTSDDPEKPDESAGADRQREDKRQTPPQTPQAETAPTQPPADGGKKAEDKPKPEKSKIPKPPKDRLLDKKLNEDLQKAKFCITAEQAKGLFAIVDMKKVDVEKVLVFIKSELKVDWWDIQEQYYKKLCLLVTNNPDTITNYKPSKESGTRFVDKSLNNYYQYFNNLLNVAQVKQIEAVLVEKKIDPADWRMWLSNYSVAMNVKKIEKLIDVPESWFAFVLDAAQHNDEINGYAAAQEGKTATP